MNKSVSPWIIVDGYCATRILEGTLPYNPKDKFDYSHRVAFIEKTPRIFRDGEWIYSDGRGSGGSFPNSHLPDWECYGFDPESRAWCDQELQALGYELQDTLEPIYEEESCDVFVGFLWLPSCQETPIEVWYCHYGNIITRFSEDGPDYRSNGWNYGSKDPKKYRQYAINLLMKDREFVFDALSWNMCVVAGLIKGELIDLNTVAWAKGDFPLYAYWIKGV